jgi:hypothetical protein
MPNTNASFTPESRSERIKGQLEKLEQLSHQSAHTAGLNAFDVETEALLGALYGKGHKYVEGYKYASLGEAEAMVNLPESAQEPLTRDVPKKALQQRRQVLQGILSEMEDMEGKEEKALTGEDHEDPPGMS